MPVMPHYIKAHLMTESAMTVFELMHNQQPAQVLNANQLKWKVDRGWLGWLARRLDWLGDHADFNRKF